MTKWFIKTAKSKSGPFTTEQINEFIADGIINNKTKLATLDNKEFLPAALYPTLKHEGCNLNQTRLAVPVWAIAICSFSAIFVLISSIMIFILLNQGQPQATTVNIEEPAARLSRAKIADSEIIKPAAPVLPVSAKPVLQDKPVPNRRSNVVVAKKPKTVELPTFSNRDNFPSPIFPSGWLSVPNCETLLLEIRDLVRKAGGAAPSRFSAIRKRKLTCYPNGILYEAEADGNRKFVVLDVGNRKLLFDGTSSKLHQLNAAIPPNLANNTQAVEYLTLFCNTLQGPNGIFRVVASENMRNELQMKSSSSKNYRYLQLPSVIKRTAGDVHINAGILFGNTVFEAECIVRKSGKVEMKNDKTFDTNVSIAKQSYVNGACILNSGASSTVAAKTSARQPRRTNPKELIERVARQQAKKLMEDIGGGQDLVYNIGNVKFDEYLKRYQFDISVSFNGVFFSTDNYQIAGRVTVNPDGSSIAFARTGANEKYKEWMLNIGGLKLLDHVITEANKK